MYTEILSPTFTGMTFSQASEICFTKLNLLLLAIEMKKEEGKKIFGVVIYISHRLIDSLYLNFSNGTNATLLVG